MCQFVDNHIIKKFRWHQYQLTVEVEISRRTAASPTGFLFPDRETWIFAQQEKLEKYRENMHVITDEERQEGILQAKKIFPERTAYFHYCSLQSAQKCPPVYQTQAARPNSMSRL